MTLSPPEDWKTLANLRCDKCGHVWNGTSRSEFGPCPSCGRKFVFFGPEIGTFKRKPADPPPPDVEKLYPCEKCGVLRTKAEGGTVFTVCETCWPLLSSQPSPDAEKPYEMPNPRQPLGRLGPSAPPSLETLRALEAEIASLHGVLDCINEKVDLPEDLQHTLNEIANGCTNVACPCLRREYERAETLRAYVLHMPECEKWLWDAGFAGVTFTQSILNPGKSCSCGLDAALTGQAQGQS